MPAWEQGGPSDYSWSVKVEEVSRCVEVVQLAGWSWGGFDGVCDRAQQALSQQGAQLHHQHHHRPPPGAHLPPISTSYTPGGLVANAPIPQQHGGASDWPSMHVHDAPQGQQHPGMFNHHKLGGPRSSRPPSFSAFSPVSPVGAPPTPHSLPSAHSGGTHSAHISPVVSGNGGGGGGGGGGSNARSARLGRAAAAFVEGGSFERERERIAMSRGGGGGGSAADEAKNAEENAWSKVLDKDYAGKSESGRRFVRLFGLAQVVALARRLVLPSPAG